MRARDRVGGFTLVELLVSLGVLSICLGVVTGALLSMGEPSLELGAWPTRLKEGRERAIRDGRDVVVWPDSAHVRDPVLFLPDGRAVGAVEEGS